MTWLGISPTAKAIGALLCIKAVFRAGDNSKRINVDCSP